MPAREPRILLVLVDDEKPTRVLGRMGTSTTPFVTARWGSLPEAPIREGRIDAILYQVDGHGRSRPDAQQRLRRLAPGIPLLPFRVERPARKRTGGAGAPRHRAGEGDDHPLVAPLDPRFVEALVERERQITELRQRARRTLGEAREQGETLEALAAIVRLTGSELDPHRIVDLAMERVRLFFRLRAWLFLLADPEQGILTVEQTGGEGFAASRGTRLAVGEGIAGRAAQLRQPILVDDVGVDGSTHGAPELPGRLAARSLLAVPLLSRGRVIGVVEAIDRLNGGRFRSQDARLLSLLLEPAAVAVDNALLLRKSEELSITDDLTKLYNSRFLNATLRREVERSKRYRTPVSLIFLDLDGFKDVNDQHGHLWGSRTLVEVGAVIKGTVREIDVVSRFGGDEFTVILPQTGPEGAVTIAERIRQRIAESPFLESYGLKVRISASIGIASFPDHGRTKDDLIARADQAMYVVKGRGKNGVALAAADSPRPAAVQTVR
ncbi:MAG TPA: sensor domain-containing diguanylate cyclase [Candidatus Polarisedimenticolia bacterium]|nr:sensor domain-containing diguanylate cyclase [Candidatus Polarisedimenticolia bacterium]